MAGKGHPKPRKYKSWGARVLATNLERQYRRHQRAYNRRSMLAAAIRVRPFPKIESIQLADWGEITILPQAEYDASIAEMDTHSVPLAVYYADTVMTPFGLGTRQPGGRIVLDQVPEPSRVVAERAATGQPPLSPEDLAALEKEYAEMQRGIDDMRIAFPAGRGFGKVAAIEQLKADIDAGRVPFPAVDVTEMGETRREKYRPGR